MIELSQVVVGLVCGCALIVFGLMPGLFQELFQALEEGIGNFRDSLSSSFATPPRQDLQMGPIRQRIWLAGLGAALIVTTVLAYLSN